MNSQEAQQAQTIKRIELEIKLGRATMINDGEAKMKANVVSLLEIVDSQAQKLAEDRQAAEVLRARYTARIAGDSQAKHYERADLLFPWEKP